MDAKLSGLMPTLIFHDVELLSEKTKKPLLILYRIDVGISLKELILQQQVIPANLTVRGLNLDVTRTVEGKIKIKGVDLEGLTASAVAENDTDTTFKRWLLQKSEIGVEDFNVTWKDEQNAGLTWYFDNINFLLKNTESRHQLLLSSKLPKALGDRINLAVDIDGDIEQPDLWEAKIFVESSGVNLKSVQTYVKYKGLKLHDGIVDLKIWADWDKSKLKQLSGDVGLYDLSYQFKRNKPVKLNHIAGLFNAQYDEDNTWHVGVDKFFYIGNKKAWPESKFSLAFNISDEKNKSFYLNADYIRLEELTQIIQDNKKLAKFNFDPLLTKINNIIKIWSE